MRRFGNWEKEAGSLALGKIQEGFIEEATFLLALAGWRVWGHAVRGQNMTPGQGNTKHIHKGMNARKQKVCAGSLEVGSC